MRCLLIAPFRFSIHDNDSFMFDGAEHCLTCTRVLDPSWIDPEFRLSKRTLDLSTTWDGAEIASDAFVRACDGLPGVSFVPLTSEPGFSVMRVDRVVRVDPVANGTRFGELCEGCRQPRYVVVPGPPHLATGETIKWGFSRTDLGYGDTADFGPNRPNYLGPVILADDETAHHLNGAGLRGVHLHRP